MGERNFPHKKPKDRSGLNIYSTLIFILVILHFYRFSLFSMQPQCHCHLLSSVNIIVQNCYASEISSKIKVDLETNSNLLNKKSVSPVIIDVDFRPVQIFWTGQYFMETFRSYSCGNTLWPESLNKTAF